MGYNRFSILLTGRLMVIMLLIVVIGSLLATPGYHAATLLVGLVVGVLAWEIQAFVTRTNRELSRFLDAARYADYSQRFDLVPAGAGFGDLGETFQAILARFQSSRVQQEEELRHLRALVEHVPVPLVSIHSDGRVTIWNNAARRLFGLIHVGRVEDLGAFGDRFRDELAALPAGGRRLVPLHSYGVEQNLTVAATEVVLDGRRERLLSLQNIQSELDDSQLDAWRDLVSVLTHEILNSITPVASLAGTAEALAADAIDGAAGAGLDDGTRAVLGDVRDAVATVARRSESLMSFVSSYRELSRLPAPSMSRFAVSELIRDVRDMLAPDAFVPRLNVAVSPGGLELEADRQMLERVLVNILQNSGHALVGHSSPAVWIDARLNPNGRVTIEIADNGPGVAEDKRRQVFVPFFTTRRDGTGVGLALSRQIMVAHGGSISVDTANEGGALFRLVF